MYILLKSHIKIKKWLKTINFNDLLLKKLKIENIHNIKYEQFVKIIIFLLYSYKAIILQSIQLTNKKHKNM